MCARVNHLTALIRASENVVRQGTFIAIRRLHSDASVAGPAKVLPVEAPSPLTDLHGRVHDYLRISLTERCNLRCQYCMPAEGVPLSPSHRLLSRAEVSRVVRVAAALGVSKVRLTGGEPTIRKDLADIIQDISSIAGIRCVAMTTNGVTLTRKLVALQRAGLGALNISLDSLQHKRYEAMARRPALQKVLAGIDLALQLGYRPVKINTVLMKGFNDDEICDFVEFTRDRAVEVRFIEFMPFAGNEWKDDKLVPHKVALRALTDKYPDVMPCLPRPNDTARVWQVPGYAGSVGFISSMTKNFCSTCNRLRVTADGNLKVCLFGAAEVSLRDALRAGATDEQVETLIRTALNNKKARHAALPAAATLQQLLDPEDTSGCLPASEKTSSSSSVKTIEESLTLKTKIPQQFSQKTVKTTNFLTQDCLSFPKESLTHIKSKLTCYKTKKRPYITELTSLLPAAVFLTSKTTTNQIRLYSSDANDGPVLTHLDSKGQARMVDVGDKDVTTRVAEAECSLHVGGRLIRLLKDARIPKGDALTVAQIAGVIGAKKTSDLIPMCHPLMLDYVRVNIEMPKGECNDGGAIKIKCEVKVSSKTGVEMEALTGAAIAALTLYDMCKSVDKGMKVMNLRVVRKAGGRSGSWPKESEPDIRVKSYEQSSIKHAPPNMHI